MILFDRTNDKIFLLIRTYDKSAFNRVMRVAFEHAHDYFSISIDIRKISVFSPYNLFEVILL